ncbi:PAS domain S-box protein [Haloplanus rubicundus]|uniref:histidine kinase n=1 Tax=Haloplanus rubicundus TaxID=1547898 RepID=A0A345DZP3_9EURY|nr:PAS domain-containing sensor histidine kinase [Haloplanus rubicundus]AXG05415.1 PAS domain S-box protein [Haloplanus rubicundus]
MTTPAGFVGFTLVPAIALGLGIAYSLVSIRRLDDYRPLVLVALLGLMAAHQANEAVQYARDVGSLDAFGELVETGANLLASLTSYFLLGFLREQRRMSERLREQAHDLRRMNRAIDASGHAVYITDGEGRIDYVNPAFEELTGYAADEVLGERPDVLRAADASDTDGETGAPGHDREDERVYRRANGERYHARRTRAPIFGPDGQQQGSVTIQTDITDRKRLENDLRESLRQLRVFDRILRHNFHNDMNVIKGYAEMIQAGGDGQVARCAEIVVDRSERLLHTVDKEHEITKRLSNPQSPEPVELAPLIESVVSNVDSHGATLTVQQPADVVVRATRDIRLAIDELVTNAIDHSDRDTPTVTVDVAVHDGTAVISVADDGPGIPEMERDILTTERDIEPLYHGSGVGLWLVTLIVQQSDGQLAFHENEPRGSVVTIRLPTA